MNGFLNAYDHPAVNADLFRRIDQDIHGLTGMDVQVQFDHVRREHNRAADCLANAALDGESAESALWRLYQSGLLS
jgi:ribonuclease HI